MLNLLLFLSVLGAAASLAVKIEDIILERSRQRKLDRLIEWERAHPVPDSSTMPWRRTR